MRHPALLGRILVAEDNPVNQQVAEAVLAMRGHEVALAENGIVALEMARTDPPDLILMDVQMPGMDGLEATRQARGIPELHGVPIIALTAHALPEERRLCLEAGMDDFLTKPFRPATLFAVVDRWIEEGRRRRREPREGDDPPGDRWAAVETGRFRAVMREAGAEEAVEPVLATFLREAPDSLARLQEGLAVGPASEEMAKAAHRFKSSAGNIRARTLYRLLSRLEMAARDGREDEVGDLLAAVGTEVERVTAQLAREVGAVIS